MSAFTRGLYVNLAVQDLKRSKAFFSKLGFEFNPQFTDDKAACMVVNEHCSVMLLSAPFFQSFTQRALANPRQQTESILALSCASRAEVDRLVQVALENGGQHAMPKQDHGFMYGGSFYDVDGHHWEVMWMDRASA